MTCSLIGALVTTMDVRLALLSGLAVIILHAPSIQCDEHEYQLVRDLMRNYDSRIRPSLNASDSLNVTFGLALAQIIDVDEKNQIITTNCWLNQAWIDYKLRWDPTRYGNIKVVRLPFDAIWKPDILLYNNADVSSYRSSISTNVMVTNDGNVTWLSMMIFRSSCAIDVKYFPFDEQNCSMLFASWTYDGFQVNLQKVGEAGDTSNYIKNSEWTLVKLHSFRHVVHYSCCAEPYPDVTYIIQIRRKPLFYVFNMILPCLLITLVALMGFYIPSDSGEKVTMGITTLLSMTVFLMLVAENMPPTSDVLPLIGLYYGVTIGIVSFATAMTVITLNIHHKGLRGYEVPATIKTICFKFLARMLCLKLDHRGTGNGEGSQSEAECGQSSGGSGNSSRRPYIKLKQSNRSHTTADSHNGSSRMTVLDFVPSKDIGHGHNHDNRFEMSDRIPENGGLSPRISARLRNPGGGASGHHAGMATTNLSHGPPMSAATSAMADNFERQFLRVLQKVHQTIEKNEMRLADQDRRENIRLEWQHVALVLDRLLLVIFTVMTSAVVGGIILQAPQSRDFLFNTGEVSISWEEENMDQLQ